MSSGLPRVLKNIWRSGLKQWGWQMQVMGDAKAGTFIGADRYGNKYYEDDKDQEIHLRTRWVIYKDYYPDPLTLEDGWHAWLAHGIKEAPTKFSQSQISVRAYPHPLIEKSHSGTNKAFVTYNTCKPKYSAWKPEIKARA